MSFAACSKPLQKFFLYNKSPQLFTVRYARTRHRIPRFLIMNSYQPWPKPFNIKEVIGDFESSNPADLRDSFRRNGLLPMNKFIDRSLNMNCSGSVFDMYVPPEGDGKSSLLSINRVKDSGLSAGVSLRNLNESRKIRKYDQEFSRSRFATFGDQIYREMLSLLPNHHHEQTRLLQIVTETALSTMVQGLHNKTLLHHFIRTIEPSTVVNVRTNPGLSEGQLFAQVTLRMFSEQTVAIFDRFGRLIYGSDSVPMDVLEYVVFEKLVTEEYSHWRIHSKIIPKWMPQQMVYQRTMRVEASPPQ